jgi:hypothetical protein
MLIGGRIQCTTDGWALSVNKDPTYHTYFHLFPPGRVQSVQMMGDMSVRSVLGVASYIILYKLAGDSSRNFYGFKVLKTN